MCLVDLVGDHRLRELRVVVDVVEHVALDFLERHKSGGAAPVVLAVLHAVQDSAEVVGVGQSPRARRNRTSAVVVCVVLGPVLVIPNVFRNDVRARVAFEDHHFRVESRCREVEVDLHGQIVNDLSLFNEGLEDAAASNFAAQFGKGVEGVRHVLCVERFSVAPEHAVAQVVGQLGRCRVVGEVFGQPGVAVAVQAVSIEQRLVEEDDALLVGSAKSVRAPHTECNAAAKASTDHDGLVSRNCRNNLDFLDDFNFLLNLNLFYDFNLFHNLHFLLNLNLFYDLDRLYNFNFLLNDDRLDYRLRFGTTTCDCERNHRHNGQYQQTRPSSFQTRFQVRTSIHRTGITRAADTAHRNNLRLAPLRRSNFSTLISA